jgi:hypothetical protein
MDEWNETLKCLTGTCGTGWTGAPEWVEHELVKRDGKVVRVAQGDDVGSFHEQFEGELLGVHDLDGTDEKMTDASVDG